jgi:RsmE family RNA methyltransferase
MANAKYLGEVSIQIGQKLSVNNLFKSELGTSFTAVWRDPLTKKSFKGRFLIIDRFDHEMVGELSEVSELLISQYFTLILGACRPQMLKRILEVAGTFPIEKIVIVASERAEKSYLSSSVLKDQAYLKYLEKGVEQAGIPNIPDVQVVDKFWTLGEYIDFDSYKLKLVCDGESNTGIGNFVRAEARVLLAIGPESGWVQKEIESFTKWKFDKVHLGEGILRVDVALISALSILRSDIY